MSSTRISRGGTAMSYVMNIPRGLSFRRFDNANASSNMNTASAVSEIKPAGPLARVNSISKPSAPADGGDYHRRQDHLHDRKGSGSSHGFGIYPTGSRHTFVYEPSLSSKLELPLPSESDADSFISFPGDNMSTLARSSMETLQSGLGGGRDDYSDSDTESGHQTPRRAVVPVNLPALIEAQKSGGIINLALPEASVASDSDSESTVTGDYYQSNEYRPMPPPKDTREVVFPSGPAPRATTVSTPRRPDISGVIPIPDARTPRTNYTMADASNFNRPVPGRRGSDDRQAFPPGLSSTPPKVSPTSETHPDNRSGPSYPPMRRERRESFSVPSSRPLEPAPPRGNMPGPSTSIRGPEMRTAEPVPADSGRSTQQAARAPQQPLVLPSNRRPSLQGGRDVLAAQGGAASQIRPQPASKEVSVRVRWDENLICPSPIPKHERRKGWFNCRGDQLWTNQGAYRPPPPGQEYPHDLRHYPDVGTGWMNEECVRIDMQHRLIPKPPLRSALKRTRNPSGGANVY